MTDFLVVGGGLVGLLTAWELEQAGARVHVLERGAVGRESSWAGGGILSPLYPWRYPEPVTALAQWSQEHYQVFSERLAAETGIDPEWTRSGLLVLDTQEREAALAWAQGHGYELQCLTPASVRDCEPALQEPGSEGLWMPQVAQIRNPRLLKALRARVEAAGVTVSEHCPVEEVRVVRGRATGVLTPDGLVSGGQVVIAGGAWSRGILGGTGCDLPVEPVRGQMLLFSGPPGLVSHVLLSRDRYVIPRRDGRVLVGSTLERVGFKKITTEQALADLLASAWRIVPALKEAPIELHWAGLRPGSPTGVPYVGEHPSIRGLFVNTGHYRNGVVLGLASGRLLADLALGRSPILDAAPYAPGREHDG